MPSMSRAAYGRLVARLIRNPPHLSRKRLPEGYNIGRCLLEIKNEKYISGPCSYGPYGDGYEINGPRQVYEGIDFPEPEVYVESISTDHFAIVLPIQNRWYGTWNGYIHATHAQISVGSLKGDGGLMIRRGACWKNDTAKICIWPRKKAR